MKHAFIGLALLIHVVTVVSDAEATLPRFLRTAGDGMRTRIKSTAGGIIYGGTPFDTDEYNSGWVDSAVGDATAAIDSGGVSSFSTADSAIGVGLDGQTLISTPLLSQGVILLEDSGTGSVNGSVGVLTEWDVEWTVDDEGGLRDFSHEYTVQCEISLSHSMLATGGMSTMEIMAFPSAVGYASGTRKYGDAFFIRIEAGGEIIEVTYDPYESEWVSSNGVVSVSYPNNDDVEIVVSKNVVLEDGDSVSVTGQIGVNYTILSADPAVEGVYTLAVDAKLIP